MKDYKLRLMLGAYGQRAASLLKRATPTVTNNLGFYGLIHRTRDVHTCCWAFVSGAVTACVNVLCLLQPYMVYAYIMVLFVCLFVWGISSHSRIVHSYVYVIFAGEWLQILTYDRHSWPLSSDGSLACHTYCDTGHPFMVIPEDFWYSLLLPNV